MTLQLVGGAVGALLLLASPALFATAGTDVLFAGVLPVAFFGCGAVAQVLRPQHVVGERLLQTGALHLVAISLGLLASGTTDSRWASFGLAGVATLLFALGFVALLDALARFPDGRYGHPLVVPVVRGAAGAGLGLAALALIASVRVPSMVDETGPANPLHVPALASTFADLGGAAFLLPVLGLLLLAVRYRDADAGERGQMRWPLLTAAAVAVGLLTTSLLEEALGPDGQAALFVTAAAALPASLLVGLLRHDEEAERRMAVEESRARLAEATAEERRRLERDLHDGAQQHLIGLLAQVELVRERLDAVDPEAARQLVEIRDGLSSAHRELRELGQGIHPSALTDHGLAEAVRSAMARMPGQPTLTIDPEVESARYGPGVESAVYLFILECLTNAMKHTDDDAVRVELAASPRGLVATVADRGPGIPPEAANGSGLTGLRDRLAAVGGTIEVASGRDGTTVSGVVPAVPRG